jgi:hypothetical protein
MSRPDPTTREVAPCKDCTEKFTACHDYCDKFKKYKAIREKENEARRKYDRKPFVQYNPFDY